MQQQKSDSRPNKRVFDGLREAILLGDFPPGHKLKAGKLAETHEVGVNLVREALTRLAGERLIEFEPNTGFAVRSLSSRDLYDLVAQRILIESAALRLCMQRTTLDWQSEVLAAHHRMEHTPLIVERDKRPALNPNWISRHDDFHAIVLQQCDSERLFAFSRQMAAEAEIYQRALLPLADYGNQMEQEHRELLGAILSSNAEEALNVLSRHLIAGRDAMLAVLEREPWSVRRRQI